MGSVGQFWAGSRRDFHGLDVVDECKGQRLRLSLDSGAGVDHKLALPVRP